MQYMQYGYDINIGHGDITSWAGKIITRFDNLLKSNKLTDQKSNTHH